MKRRVALIALLLCSYAHAETPLGLDEVLRSVDRSLPAIAASLEDMNTAEADVAASRGAFDPTLKVRGSMTPLGYYKTYRIDALIEQQIPYTGISAIAGYRLGVGNFAVYDGKAETNERGELRAAINVPILRNAWTDRRRADVARTELGRPMAQLNVRMMRIDGARLAAYRYWDWVAAGRRLAIAEALYELAVTRDEALRQRLARGDLAAIERSDNQRALKQRFAATVAAKRSVEQAAIELSLFLRDAQGQPVVATVAQLPIDFPAATDLDSEIDAAGQRAAQQRPDVRRLRLVRGQLDIERRYAFNQLFPALDAGVLVSQDFGEGSYTRAKLEVEAFAWLEVPLTFRVQRARLAAVEAATRRLEQVTRAQRDRATADVRDAGSAMRAAKERIRVLSEEVALAVQLEDAERTRYTLGDSNLIYVNLREQTTAEARARLVDATADFHRGVAAWTAATAF